jgi:DNA-binding LacI/PurR family transcriptional regulator
VPATLKDVAALARVSLTTASHALNGKEVNEETRKRVIEAARKLKYYKSSIGRNLILNKSNTIGMFVLNSKMSKDMTEDISYYYGLIKGALASIQKHGYLFNFEVVYWEDIANSDFIDRKIYGRSLDGMILIPQFMYYYNFLSSLENEQFPYIIINPSTNIKSQSRVVFDNYKGGYLAADYLLGLGHENLAFINGPENHYDAYQREKGFFARLLEGGVKFDRKKIVYSDFTTDGGYEAMENIIRKNVELPTAVFCANDYMASGAMGAVYDEGLKVPEDISIIGYDDIDVARAVYPKLTTIRSPVKEIGFEAAERVLAMVEDRDGDTKAQLNEIIFEPALVERGSTCRR